MRYVCVCVLSMHTRYVCMNASVHEGMHARSNRRGCTDECELDMFDDIMELVIRGRPGFGEVIAVGGESDISGRTWRVAVRVSLRVTSMESFLSYTFTDAPLIGRRGCSVRALGAALALCDARVARRACGA